MFEDLIYKIFLIYLIRRNSKTWEITKYIQYFLVDFHNYQFLIISMEFNMNFNMGEKISKYKIYEPSSLNKISCDNEFLQIQMKVKITTKKNIISFLKWL